MLPINPSACLHVSLQFVRYLQKSVDLHIYIFSFIRETLFFQFFSKKYTVRNFEAAHTYLSCQKKSNNNMQIISPS